MDRVARRLSFWRSATLLVGSRLLASVWRSAASWRDEALSWACSRSRPAIWSPPCCVPGGRAWHDELRPKRDLVDHGEVWSCSSPSWRAAGPTSSYSRRTGRRIGAPASRIRASRRFPTSAGRSPPPARHAPGTLRAERVRINARGATSRTEDASSLTVDGVAVGPVRAHGSAPERRRRCSRGDLVGAFRASFCPFFGEKI